MEPDEITRRLLAHFGTERGWHPSDWDGCRCGSCVEGQCCDVPGIFEALGLPVPEPTYTPAPRPAVTRVDMSAVKQLEAAPSKLMSFTSSLVNPDYRHTRPPFTVVRPTPSA